MAGGTSSTLRLQSGANHVSHIYSLPPTLEEDPKSPPRFTDEENEAKEVRVAARPSPATEWRGRGHVLTGHGVAVKLEPS